MALRASRAPAVGFAIAGVHGLLGGSTPDFSNLSGWWIRRAEQMRVGGWNVMEQEPVGNFGLIDWLVRVTEAGPWSAALVWAAMALANGGISEEPGWRGYTQPQLERNRTALEASVLTGLLWGLWHFGPDSWKLVFEGKPLVAILLPLGTTFGTIPLAVVFACLYHNTKGSFLLPIVFHATVNSTYTFFNLVWPGAPFYLRYPEFALGHALVAAILVQRFGALRLTREPATTRP